MVPGCLQRPRYVDNWRPASERREVRDVRDGLPQEDVGADDMRNIKLPSGKLT
jgi:hypothetical protein